MSGGDLTSFPLYVTQPALPPLEEFLPYLEQIWETRQLTNNGPFHQQFEKALCDFLDVEYISLFTNGTLALVTALQALRISGEVITTPFSFVATTHALHWNGIKPIFVDIESDCFNLDPELIEAAITPRTTAILPVHIYGRPCRINRIREIADIYGLKVIYDACHAFGVRHEGISVLRAGDLSILSFHATKVFNTFEGGAIVSHDEATKKRIDYLKNFGFANETTVVAPGINAKMNEFQAALGLLQLKYVHGVTSRRKKLTELYRESLKGIPGLSLPSDELKDEANFAYFPLLVDSDRFGKTRDELYSCMRERGILTRRYFYPLISHFPTYKGLPSASATNLPVAESVSARILCLPLYPALTPIDVERVCAVISEGK